MVRVRLAEAAMTWTHPICAECWYTENPGKHATAVAAPELERCCICGQLTGVGIYIRRDPKTVPYPSEDE